MPLYIMEKDVSRTRFRDEKGWDPPRCASMPEVQPVFYSIQTPPGKHGVDMCPLYEGQWRECATRVICALRDESKAYFVWAEGPMEAGGLPDLLPYMVDVSGEHTDRYHIESTTHTEKGSYQRTWVSFEFCEASFQAMAADANLGLEYNCLSLLVFPEQYLDNVIIKPFWSIGADWVLQHDALAIVMHRHFEGGCVFGRRETVEAAVARVRTGLADMIADPGHPPRRSDRV
jgi:hypothetical protein